MASFLFTSSSSLSLGSLPWFHHSSRLIKGKSSQKAFQTNIFIRMGVRFLAGSPSRKLFPPFELFGLHTC
jgi:hypothetical protein